MMTISPFGIRPYCVLLMALLGFAAGCGLDEYEKRIDEKRAWLQTLDEENKSLGDPVDLPPSPDDPEKSPPALSEVGLFLRPPKGIAKSPVAETARYDNTELHRYPGAEGHNLYLGANSGTPRKKTTPEDEMRFQVEVLGAVRQAWLHQSGRMLPLPVADEYQKQLKSLEFQPAYDRGKKLVPIKLKRIVLDEQATHENAALFMVYFHHVEDKQLAVVFQFPLAAQKEQETKKAMEASLKTIGLGGAAAVNKKHYEELLPLLQMKK